MTWIKYRIQKKQEYVSGSGWQDVTPLETRTGDIVDIYSSYDNCYSASTGSYKLIQIFGSGTTYTECNNNTEIDGVRGSGIDEEDVDKNLTEAWIGDCTIAINTNAFKNCESLSSITIANSVMSFGGCTFEGCISLGTIRIPDNITFIGRMSFFGCHSLTAITNMPDVLSRQTTLFDYTFADCPMLTSIKIPSNITEIGPICFASSGFERIDLPSGVTTIGAQAFFNCSGLTIVNFPNGVTEIKTSTFQGCSSLSGITIPNGVTTISHQAFRYCYSLTSIDIPNSVTSIGSRAFEGCSGLTTCIIGSGVASIDYYAFSGCSSLQSVTVNRATPPTLPRQTDTGVFDGSTCPIYVPSESVNTYKAASGWSDYASRIQAIPT